jgi:hypothetical protein
MANIIKYTTNDAYMLNRQIGPPIDTGYSVNIPNINVNDKENWNVRLIKLNKKYLNLWVDDAMIDFSMSGLTGQSRYKREFYPHSFNEPTLILKGIMPNQREYNKLAAFVRESHSEALNVNKNLSEKSAGTKVYPTVSLIMKSSVQQKGNPRNQKGKRMGMKLEGYMKSIAAGAAKFEFAPTFEIQFVVAASDGTVGIYGDEVVGGSVIVDWMTLFKNGHFGAKSGYQIRTDISKPTYVNASGETVTTQPTGAEINHRGVSPTNLTH